MIRHQHLGAIEARRWPRLRRPAPTAAPSPPRRRCTASAQASVRSATSAIALTGQAEKHSPQPVHRAARSRGSGGPPKRGLKPIACSGQASPQDWQWTKRRARHVSSIATGADRPNARKDRRLVSRARNVPAGREARRPAGTSRRRSPSRPRRRRRRLAISGSPARRKPEARSAASAAWLAAAGWSAGSPRVHLVT